MPPRFLSFPRLMACFPPFLFLCGLLGHEESHFFLQFIMCIAAWNTTATARYQWRLSVGDHANWRDKYKSNGNITTQLKGSFSSVGSLARRERISEEPRYGSDAWVGYRTPCAPTHICNIGDSHSRSRVTVELLRG